MWIRRWTPGVFSIASTIFCCASRVADSPSSSDFISIARKIATTTSRTPIAIEPRPSKMPLPVTASARRRSARAPDRSARRSPRAGSPGARASGRCGRTSPSRPCPRILFASTIAVRNDSVSMMIAATSTATGTHFQLSMPVRVVDLVPALVEREQATDAEQHDRHDERVDVPLPAEAELVQLVGLALGALAADQQQHLVRRRRRASGSTRPASRPTGSVPTRRTW